MTERHDAPHDQSTPAAAPAEASRAPCLIVGIGASAGGLEAFEQFFTRMPPDSGTAFVLIQHLAPDHASLLPDLLARYTPMPVRQVTAETRVEPDHVYVIPPNATLTITDGVLHVASPPVEPRGHRTPIDHFFYSLAADQGDHGVCILLSGTGTDGTLGLQAVKEYGGMAMAQTAASALYDGILRSAIATGLVDHILPVEAMPAKLVEYATHLTGLGTAEPTDRPTPAGDPLHTIHGLLRRQTGHDFRQYKENTVRRRLQRRMQALQLDAMDSYLARLQQDPSEIEFLFKDLLIGVTHFFRDPEAFAALDRAVLPQLFASKGATDQVRVCVAGCASGEEAYSLAILLREHMDRLASVPHAQVFATDIDAQALEVARRGHYPEGIAEHVSAERLARFFVKQDHTYQVQPALRELCIFSVHSFIKDPPFARLDLLSCRNVLIYLEPDLQRKLIPLFYYALRPGGYLFLGPSETLTGQEALFRPLDPKHRIFQKKEVIPRPPVEFPLTNVRHFPPGTRTAPGHPRPTAAQDLGTLVQRTLLEHYAPACVVSNAQGEAVYFSGRTGRYLEPPVGTPTMHLLSMAREGLRPVLRAALHQAVTRQQRAVYEQVAVRINGGVQPITLVVEPLTAPGADAPLYLVLFQDVAPAALPAPPATAATPRPEEGLLEHLEHELRVTKEHLQTLIEELETSNEELSSANEELQSTNEELETSKEELQSLNEELETLNTELRRKVQDLDRANSDLQNLLDSTQIATLFLDTALHITSFTPASNALLPLRHSDVGRPLADLALGLEGADLVSDARAVLRTLAMQERYVRTADATRRYLVRLLPYRTVANVIDGVVLSFVEVTALVHAEEAARAAQTYAESIVHTIREALLVLDPSLHVQAANRAFYAMFQATPADTEGRLLYTLGHGQWDIPALRQLLEEVLQQHTAFEDFVIEHDFPGLGRKVLRLNARQVAERRPEQALLLLAIEDSTARQQLEDAVQQAQAVLEQRVEERSTALHHEMAERQRLEYAAQRAEHFALLGRLAAGVSHEIRNPLGAVFLQVDLLAEALQDPSPESPAEVAESLAEIRTNLARVDDLVQDYLALVRAGAIAPAVQDLGAAVQAWSAEFQALAAAVGVTLQVNGLATLGTVAFHANTLRRAVLNLVHNALEALAPGGTLTLAGQGTAAAVQLQVQDTGSGIPAERLEQIFEPLYTTKPGGTGLGLYIVQEIVAAHGGQFTVASVEGQGTTCTITLPRTASQTPAPSGGDA